MNTLQITENAKKQIAKLLLNETKGSFFSSFWSQEVVALGFKYSFSIDNNSNTNDILVGKVIIDKTSHEFIKNSKLDYEENLMGKSFRINNPDAKASCGCGISFSI